MNYASCHDNLTLMDRLTRSATNASREDRIRMNNLAAAIYLTAEGIPFMQAGEEMLRTKITSGGTFDENSYSSPDSVNSLKWDTLEEEEYWNVYQYYKGLIAFRKAHGALRLNNAQDVEQNVKVVEGLPENVTAFQINGGVNGETSDGIFVIFNPNREACGVSLPEGAWDVCIDGEKAGTEALETVSGTVSVEPISALVMVKSTGEAPKIQQEAEPEEEAAPGDAAVEEEGGRKLSAGVIGILVCAAVVLVAAIAAVSRKKKK